MLTTVGLDAGYTITPSLLASLGGYYQNGDLDDDGNPEVDNVGILGRLAYAINSEVSIGANLSYDASFDTRFSADIKWRFNTNGGPGKETPKSNAPVEALASTPSNRNVRVHDDSYYKYCSTNWDVLVADLTFQTCCGTLSSYCY